jgi:hypothetical protein
MEQARAEAIRKGIAIEDEREAADGALRRWTWPYK